RVVEGRRGRGGNRLDRRQMLRRRRGEGGLEMLRLYLAERRQSGSVVPRRGEQRVVLRGGHGVAPDLAVMSPVRSGWGKRPRTTIFRHAGLVPGIPGFDTKPGARK